MLTAGLIARKRDGGALSAAEWRQVIAEVATGTAPDYQIAALLMAVVFRGLTDTELDVLTDAMSASGRQLGFGADTPPRVDKHSTGGVGDKTSLILAPLVASCGLAVPMIVGRGLGHTGGTLDKLEAIPGFDTALTVDAAQRQVARIGCAIFGQSAEIAPADRRLYALRDATGTVESIPLIAASIMSKKLAEDLRGLVVDLKAGSGAFLPDAEQGLALARTMIALGAARACPTVVRITAMDRPLGHACGNALETEEALLALRGECPPDLLEVTLALGTEMLLLGGVAEEVGEARRQLSAALASGAAAERCRALIAAQGGNPALVDDPAGLPQAPHTAVWAAPRSGFITTVAPRPIGEGIIALGGGRRRIGDPVDPAVGFVVTAKPGQPVEAGEPLATVHARDTGGLATGRRVLDAAITIGEEAPPDLLPLLGARLADETATGN